MPRPKSLSYQASEPYKMAHLAHHSLLTATVRGCDLQALQTHS